MPLKRFELSEREAPTASFLTRLVDALRKALPGPLLNALGTLLADKTLDLAASDVTTVTLGANVTLTLSSARPGTSAFLELAQDGTGGRTVTLSGATVPGWTMTATASKKDMLCLVRNQTTWVGNIHAQSY